MNHVFPKINQQTIGDGGFFIPACLGIYAEAGFEETAAHLAELITLLHGIPAEPAEQGGTITLRRRALGAEAYVIEVTETGACLSAATERGMGYAAATLVQLIEATESGFVIPVQTVEDAPYLPVRGIHAYMPARRDIPEFLRIVDTLAFLKMNTLILEIGGAMEYKRHPEINEGWIEYCKIFKEYNGKAIATQRSYKFPKDSIHIETGEGDYLTEAQMKEILDYCAARHIEVIPEMPCFSHADYILYAHPEFAEDPEEPLPSFACPSNEDYYKLLFDLFDDVIRVFQPKRINVGHDELYVLGYCPRCKGKKAADLLAGDLTKIRDFLASRGVKTMLWGDKVAKAWHGGNPAFHVRLPADGETLTYKGKTYEHRSFMCRSIPEFLEYVKDGMSITIEEDGTVIVE